MADDLAQEALPDGGDAVGLVELTHPEPDWCAIDFLGLVPAWIGRGQGRWLLASALALAWRPDVTRVGVNTCTLDHPAALPNYLRAGFRVPGRSVETFPDPRLSGILPAHLAHVTLPKANDSFLGKLPAGVGLRLRFQLRDLIRSR